MIVDPLFETIGYKVCKTLVNVSPEFVNWVCDFQGTAAGNVPVFYNQWMIGAIVAFVSLGGLIGIFSKAFSLTPKVRQQRLPEWVPPEDAKLIYSTGSTPPPIPGYAVNNWAAWVLALVPIIVLLLFEATGLPTALASHLVDNLKFDRPDQVADLYSFIVNAVFWGSFWALFAIFGAIDSYLIRKSKYEWSLMESFWLYIVAPVYFYRRARATGQSWACFWTYLFSLLVLVVVMLNY